jgi:hypothetical protein
MHAARYATKYLLKPPEGGYPEWVWKFPGNIKKHGSSRGFWKSGDPVEDETDFQTGFPKRDQTNSKKRKHSKQTKTIEERTKRCGIPAVVMEVTENPNKDGSKRPSYRYIGSAAVPFPMLQKEFGQPEGSTKSFEIPRTKINHVEGKETPGSRETWQLDRTPESISENPETGEEN